MPDLFDFEKKPDRYAVLGNPIAHSKSPAIHQMFAEQTRQFIIYEAFFVDIGGFEQAVGNFFAAGGKGLNVTVPFKEEAWQLVDQRSERAQLAGAVNTIKLVGEDERFGDNTDGTGLVRDLKQNHQIELRGKRILLLGAGGAARGVLLPLLVEQPSLLQVANRNADKAQILSETFKSHGTIVGSSFTALANHSFDLVINATSASLQGQLPALPEGVFAPHAISYDMMYSAQATPFQAWSRTQGVATCLDGLGMLVEQAAEAFFIWRGVIPETQPVISALRHSLNKV